MGKKELENLVTLIAQRTTDMVVEKLRGDMRGQADTEYVNSKEAARILGVTPNYLRQVKDKYPHIKAGDKNAGRIMFRRDALLSEFK